MSKKLIFDLWIHVPFYDDRKDDASPKAGLVAVTSYTNSRFVEVLQDPDGGFRGSRKWNYINLPSDVRHVWGADGIGTATVLADALMREGVEAMRNIGRNFVAMVADDRIKEGDLPLVLFSDISVRNHHDAGYEALMIWTGEVLKEQELVLIGWETATLWPCVGSPNPQSQFAFNMSWVALWVNHPQMEVTGKKVLAWDYIVALAQKWFWSNGLSVARRALSLRFGPNYYQDAPIEILRDVVTPCVVYSRAVGEALWWFNPELVRLLQAGERPGLDIHAIAHLSWGGLIEKFWKPFLVRNGLSADLDNLFPVPEIAQNLFNWLQEAGQWMTPEEFYKTWCNGQRMLVVLPTLEEAERLIQIVGDFWVQAQVAGRVIETPKGKNSQILIKS